MAAFSILGIVTLVLGSSILSAIITGIFTYIKSNNEWRNNHLTEDKKDIREIIFEVNSLLQFYVLERIVETNINETQLNQFLLDVEMKTQKLLIYLDATNPNSRRLRIHFLHLKDKLTKYLIIQKKKQDENQVFTCEEQELDMNIPKEFLNISSKIKQCITEYFAYYYPQKFFIIRIYEYFCNKENVLEFVGKRYYEKQYYPK